MLITALIRLDYGSFSRRR